MPPPADLAAPCPGLERADVRDMGELLAWTTELVALYGDCAARHRALSCWATPSACAAGDD